eukprot:230416-Pelagomonas_calceolata.AAC.1
MQLSPQLLANSLHASMLSIAMCIHTGVLALTQPAALQHLAHQLRTCLQLAFVREPLPSLVGQHFSTCHLSYLLTACSTSLFSAYLLRSHPGAFALTEPAALQHLVPQLRAKSLYATSLFTPTLRACMQEPLPSLSRLRFSTWCLIQSNSGSNTKWARIDRYSSSNGDNEAEEAKRVNGGSSNGTKAAINVVADSSFHDGAAAAGHQGMPGTSKVALVPGQPLPLPEELGSYPHMVGEGQRGVLTKCCLALLASALEAPGQSDPS